MATPQKPSELRMAIGSRITHDLDEQSLILIHEKLMATEEGEAAKIPVTVKLEFLIDDSEEGGGELACDVTIKCALPISKKRMHLRSDGKQLKLWGDRPSKAVADPKPPATNKAPAKKAAAKKAPTKAAPKKAAAKPGMNGTKKPAAVPPRPRPAKPTVSAEERREEIIKNNTKLYVDGSINRDQAIQGGVDVDQVDGLSGDGALDEMDLAADLGGEINDLTDEEREAIDSLGD